MATHLVCEFGLPQRFRSAFCQASQLITVFAKALMNRKIGRQLNDALVGLIALEHLFDPYFRDTFDRLFQRPLVSGIQFLLRSLRSTGERHLCQEIAMPDEDLITAGIIEEMSKFAKREYAGKIAERGGNTKTYGLVRAEFRVLDDLPSAFRKGIFSTPRPFPAWIRFGGSGPLSPPDIKDAGIVSIGVKLMDVPGEKLLPDEKWTQDFLGISSPTFSTPNIQENIKLQRHVYANTPVFYFLNPLDSHYLDFAMQVLFARMNRSPLEARYWSCVPYLLGEGTAIKYSIMPRIKSRTRIPWNPPADWLRQAMSETLSRNEVEFDFAVQVQTDPVKMPIEDSSIDWPESISPFVPVARIRIQSQQFESPQQFKFARELSCNPWHAIPEHRPLGNLNRARRAIYLELSRLRQGMNKESHVEPDGSESFAT